MSLWEWAAMGALGLFLAGLLLGLGFWCGLGFWQARSDLRVARLYVRESERCTKQSTSTD